MVLEKKSYLSVLRFSANTTKNQSQIISQWGYLHMITVFESASQKDCNEQFFINILLIFTASLTKL